MIFALSIVDRSHFYGKGYIAGTADGIVTVANQPAHREIFVLHLGDNINSVTVARTWSLDDGHYLIPNLDESKEYLVIARDYKREYEPVAYDCVKPATDLTLAEQRELWRSWQT